MIFLLFLIGIALTVAALPYFVTIATKKEIFQPNAKLSVYRVIITLIIIVVSYLPITGTFIGMMAFNSRPTWANFAIGYIGLICWFSVFKLASKWVVNLTPSKFWLYMAAFSPIIAFANKGYAFAIFALPVLLFNYSLVTYFFIKIRNFKNLNSNNNSGDLL